MTRNFRNLDLTVLGRLTVNAEERFKKHAGTRELATDALNLVESAGLFYSGIYPLEAPYFFWGSGLWLPWADQTREKSEICVLDDLEFRRIATELLRIGTRDSSGHPIVAVTYLSEKLCSTQEGNVQGLAIEIMIAVDEYLEYLSMGRPHEAIPWLSTAYANLIEADFQCRDILGNAGIEEAQARPQAIWQKCRPLGDAA